MCLEWHGSIEHCIQENTKTPNVDEKAFITFINYDLWCQISRSATLFLNYLALFDDLGYSKIAYLYALFAVKKNIIELDIAMNH